MFIAIVDFTVAAASRETALAALLAEAEAVRSMPSNIAWPTSLSTSPCHSQQNNPQKKQRQTIRRAGLRADDNLSTLARELVRACCVFTDGDQPHGTPRSTVRPHFQPGCALARSPFHALLPPSIDFRHTAAFGDRRSRASTSAIAQGDCSRTFGEPEKQHSVDWSHREMCASTNASW